MVPIRRFPHEPVLLSGKADVLRTMGRYEDAVEVYASAVERFPFEPAAFNGYAETVRDIGDISGALRIYEVAVNKFPQDVRVRSGQAKTLQVAGRYADALQAFDKNVRDFPYDLFGLTGRANLLRLLGRYNDAVEAYEAIIVRRPDYAAARNGKAAVLILLGKLDLADAMLPRENPTTSIEWVGYHIRGMMYLKSGNIEDAIKVFTYGIQKNPFHRERSLFESGLAAAKIRIREFEPAARLLEQTSGVIAKLLQMHSFAAIGNIDRAKAAMLAVNDNEPPGVVHLREALATKFSLKPGGADRGDAWILNQEAEILLQAA